MDTLRGHVNNVSCVLFHPKQVRHRVECEWAGARGGVGGDRRGGSYSCGLWKLVALMHLHACPYSTALMLRNVQGIQCGTLPAMQSRAIELAECDRAFDKMTCV